MNTTGKHEPRSNSVKRIAAEVRDVCFFVGPSERVLSRLSRNPAQLIVVLGGVYSADVDAAGGRERIRATAGDVVLWPAGQDHTDASEPGRPLRCIVIWFYWPMPPAGLPFQMRDHAHVIETLAHRLLALAHEPTRLTELGAEADAYLNAMLAEFIGLSRVAAHPLLSRVTAYIEAHIHEAIRLGDLARHVGLEKHHFGRKYRQLTGRTPMQDVRRRKAAYAKHILQLNPRQKLAFVAELVGIPHVATLSRLLPRHAGSTARDIKRQANR